MNLIIEEQGVMIRIYSMSQLCKPVWSSGSRTTIMLGDEIKSCNIVGV